MAMIASMAANKPTGAAIQTSGSNWTKWHIAIAIGIGAPVALGLGYWYYRSHRYSVKRLDSAESGSKDATAYENQVDGKLDDDIENDPILKAQGRKNKGNKFFKAGKYDEAIKCYTEAIDICPPEKCDDRATFYQNRAAAYEQLKNYQKVIDDCSAALDLNCRYSKALNRRAKAYEVMKDLKKCLEDVTAVCILEGFQNQNSLLMADRVLKQLGKQRAQEEVKQKTPILPSEHFMKSYFSSFSNDPIMNSLKNEDIDAADISGYLKARQDLKQHRFNNVVSCCDEELQNENSPWIAEALLLRATFFIFRGQGSLAAQDLERIVNMDTNEKVKVNAYIKLGSLKIQEDRPDKALEYFSKAEKLDPNNCDIYHHRGQINLMMDNMQNALKDFAKAVELNPTFPIAYVQKCYADCRNALNQRSSSGGVQIVIDMFEEATKKFPNCVEGFALYGQVLTERQEFEKADELFEKALSLDPDNANILVHRGLLKLQWKQDVEGAIEMISEAIKMDDKCEFAYETLGTLEVQRGSLERAVELFKKAIAFAKTEAEMAHLYSLTDAALAQAQVAKRLGIQIPQPI